MLKKQNVEKSAARWMMALGAAAGLTYYACAAEVVGLTDQPATAIDYGEQIEVDFRDKGEFNVLATFSPLVPGGSQSLSNVLQNWRGLPKPRGFTGAEIARVPEKLTVQTFSPAPGDGHVAGYAFSFSRERTAEQDFPFLLEIMNRVCVIQFKSQEKKKCDHLRAQWKSGGLVKVTAIAEAKRACQRTIRGWFSDPSAGSGSQGSNKSPCEYEIGKMKNGQLVFVNSLAAFCNGRAYDQTTCSYTRPPTKEEIARDPTLPLTCGYRLNIGITNMPGPGWFVRCKG